MGTDLYRTGQLFASYVPSSVSSCQLCGSLGAEWPAKGMKCEPIPHSWTEIKWPWGFIRCDVTSTYSRPYPSHWLAVKVEVNHAEDSPFLFKWKGLPQWQYMIDNGEGGGGGDGAAELSRAVVVLQASLDNSRCLFYLNCRCCLQFHIYWMQGSVMSLSWFFLCMCAFI